VCMLLYCTFCLALCRSAVRSQPRTLLHARALPHARAMLHARALLHARAMLHARALLHAPTLLHARALLHSRALLQPLFLLCFYNKITPSSTPPAVTMRSKLTQSCGIFPPIALTDRYTPKHHKLTPCHQTPCCRDSKAVFCERCKGGHGACQYLQYMQYDNA